jgi:hypothetical protein
METALPKAYDELVEIFSEKMSPEEVMEIKVSPATQERVRYLRDVNSKGTITPEELAELDDYVKLDHLMRRLKIRAYEKLRQGK